TEETPYECKHNREPRQLQHECGSDDRGQGFLKHGRRGVLVAVGKMVRANLRWYPAKETQMAKTMSPEDEALLRYPANYKIYSASRLDGVVIKGRWKRDYTEDEKAACCGRSAEAKVKTPPSKKTVEEPDNDCEKNGYCLHIFCNVVGMLDYKGRWREIIHNCQEDADLLWHGTQGACMYDFLGVLQINRPYTEKGETWLIFNEPGIEGDGIYAIELEDVGKRKPPSAESLVYNGC
ncbi:MAG: hypothetical protein V2B18_15545, partial [Pseudomonadota bacterium]